MASECVTRLEKASNEVIRRVLTALCESDAEIEEKASACLDAFTSEHYRSHVDGSERQQELKAATKRKADESLPEVYLCRNCGEGFIEEHNGDRACFHHPGREKPDHSPFKSRFSLTRLSRVPGCRLRVVNVGRLGRARPRHHRQRGKPQRIPRGLQVGLLR